MWIDLETKTTEQSKIRLRYPNNHFHHYYGFGLHIVSEFECPELSPIAAAHSSPDVVIRVGFVPSILEGQQLDDGFSQVKPDAYLLRLDNIANYYVTNGCEIVVQPHASCSDSLIRLYLFSQCIGALLHQRHQLILHASAIATDQGALIFMGPSGSGKSTLAAGLIDTGYKLLAEDLCALEFSPGRGFQVLPGMAQLRLWHDTIQQLGHNKKLMQRVWQKEDKYSRLLQDELASVPTALKMIYLLNPADVETVEITPLSLPEMTAAIVKNVFRGEYTQALGVQKRLFRQTAELIRAGQICQLTRPRNGFSLINQIKLLQKVHSL